jgi:hypothetical protein
MRTWPVRRWAVTAAVTAVAAVVIGVPTGVISTPFYTRMTPVLWWNYPVWLISSVLEGLLVATYVRVGDPAPSEEAAAPRPRTGRALGAGLLSAFAIGCPRPTRKPQLIELKHGSPTRSEPTEELPLTRFRGL